MGQHQAGGASADDSDLRAHGDYPLDNKARLTRGGRQVFGHGLVRLAEAVNGLVP